MLLPMKPTRLLQSAVLLSVIATLCGCITKVSSRSKLAGNAVGGQTESVGEIKRDAETPQRLATGKRTYVLLQVDGGGIMGITPATLLAHLEQEMQRRRPGFQGKKLKDILSVCLGTSTGSIITGMVTAGVPARDIAGFYTGDGVRLFQSEGRNWFFPLGPKYKRDKFQDTLFSVLDGTHPRRGEVRLSDLDKQPGGAPLLIIPAYDLRSKRTHFLRSRGFKDKPLASAYDMQLVDAISCSALNAALYFGKVTAPDQHWEYVQADGSRQMMTGAVYNDGGQGTQNNTLGLALLEAMSRGWGMANDEQVVVISLGCGDDFTPQSYARAARISGTAQLTKFLFMGQARQEAALLQWRAGRQLAAYNANYKVFRFNFVPDKASAFSVNATQLKELRDTHPGVIFQRRDFQQLVDDLCNPAVVLNGPVKEEVHENARELRLAPRGL